VCEEAFGPIAKIIRIDGIDDAIAAANETVYGLSAGVVTNNLAWAMRVIHEVKTGTVNVNEVPGYRTERSPFGGVKMSGLGVKEGVAEACKWMTNVKTFSLPW
jgi:aldehyde dehydrogenase (NAD+)